MNSYDVNFKGCSRIVIFDKGVPFIGHNEDCPEKKPANKMAKLIEFKYLDSEFTSLVYFGELAGNAVSFNKYGVSLFMNSIDEIERKNVKNQIPEYFLFRKILDCKTIEVALKIFKKYPTPTGYNCTLSQNGIILLLKNYMIKQVF